MDPNQPSPSPEHPESIKTPEPGPMAQPGPPSDAVPEQVPTRVIIHELQRQHQSLETLFALTVSGLIVLSLGLNLFLFKQVRLARAQVQQYAPVVARSVSEFHQFREAKIRSFISSLQDFARTDPELQKILEKYRPVLGKYLDSPAATPLPLK